MSAAALAERSSTSICLSEISRSRLESGYWSSSCSTIARSSKNKELSPLTFSGRSFSVLTSSTSFKAFRAPRGSPASSAVRAASVLSAWPAHANCASPSPTAATKRAACASFIGERAGGWPSRSPSRPMHPGWLRCSSVTYEQYAPSSRLASRAPRPRSSTDLAIRRPSDQGFGDRGLELEQDRAGFDVQHLNEHEVLHAALFVLTLVGGEHLARDDVAHADLLAPAGDLALIEAVLVLLAHLLHQRRLRFQADHLHVAGVDQRGLDVTDQEHTS